MSIETYCTAVITDIALSSWPRVPRVPGRFFGGFGQFLASQSLPRPFSAWPYEPQITVRYSYSTEADEPLHASLIVTAESQPERDKELF